MDKYYIDMGENHFGEHVYALYEDGAYVGYVNDTNGKTFEWLLNNGYKEAYSREQLNEAKETLEYYKELVAKMERGVVFEDVEVYV